MAAASAIAGKRIRNLLDTGKTQYEVASIIGLPAGWKAYACERHDYGSSAESYQVTFRTPELKKLTTVKKLVEFLGSTPHGLFEDLAEPSPQTLAPIRQVRHPSLRILEFQQSSMTEEETATKIGLPSGWTASARQETSGNLSVRFRTPEGELLKSVKNLIAFLGETPKGLLEDPSIPTDPSPGDIVSHAPAGLPILKRILEISEASKTEEEAAFKIGLPSGWTAHAKQAPSGNVHVRFRTPEGELAKSVKQLIGLFGETPKGLLEDSSIPTDPSPGDIVSNAPAGKRRIRGDAVTSGTSKKLKKSQELVESRGEAARGSQTDRIDDLKIELNTMTLGGLKRRARELGIPKEGLDQADDADDPRESVIKLIVSASTASNSSAEESSSSSEESTSDSDSS